MRHQSPVPETGHRAAEQQVVDSDPPVSLDMDPGDVGGAAKPFAPDSKMTDYLEHLTSELSGDYVVQRELGVGGMATVYLAHDRRHDRQVAVKVLRPDIAAALGSDRFKREIKLAAGLTHPNIMPVHDSGDAGGLLYYVMPNVSGLSLRARLDQCSRLPVNEALRIGRSVAEALDYAHRNGVVHRDIKPENILLHEGHPLVADFGIGKAMSAMGDVGLTLSGVAIGTPAYMSPEQAAGDEDLDGRSDIYSLGCVLFEMLTGEQPFTGPTAQVVIAKRFVQRPPDLTELCAEISPPVSHVVQRAMARDPNDRCQSGAEFAAAIGELLDTETHLVMLNGGTPRVRPAVRLHRDTVGRAGAALTQPTLPTARAANGLSVSRMFRGGALTAGAVGGTLGPRSESDDEAPLRNPKTPVGQSVKAATLFGLAGVGVLSIVHFLVGLLGLPDWVFPAVVVWLIAGIPVLLVTGRQEFKRTVARASGAQEMPVSGIRRHLTWRNLVMGGGVALSALVVSTASFMVMRLVGVGPGGTLVATGEFEEGGRVVLAEFADRTDDPGLVAAVTEGLRVDLGQSRVVSLVSPTAMRDALARMGLAPSTTIDRRVALEIAVRDGIPAVVTGEVLSIGHGFVITARVVNAADEQELLAIREDASDASEVLAAVERLSHRLRERIGESLRNIRRSPALRSVTTTSLPAPRRYSAVAGESGPGGRVS